MILITSVTLVISMNLCNYWICMHHNTLDVDKFMSNCSNRVCHGFGITESDFHGNGMGFQGVANHGLSTELFGLSTELFSLSTPGPRSNHTPPGTQSWIFADRSMSG